MRLTTKGRYAVTAMLDLAINSINHPVNLNDISERQAISLSYLEQLFSKLRRENLVRSIRGPGGGYQLNGSIDDISVANIINAVNESMDVSRCEGRANCHDGKQCLTHNLWVDLSDRINSFLDEITIGELIRQNEQQAMERKNQEHNTHKINLAPLN
ncbi:Fe-S cluster assembly transcriptional regulator IscR [Aliikangiella sp. IMCC44359]|uniref:Fe-S cluster assembly transcriptional regulator IscR n=1 Tax=Aliikangiella sp. IMCC44359 TaxID=3459125 RepID=UPI00403AE4D9